MNRKRNGKGKEYHENGRIIFDGNYLNGESHGEGKEYDYYNGELLFEGEYLEGKRWNGKGKEKHNIGNKSVFEGIFEGEYLNGKRWFGKLYDKKGYLRFDGQFQLNGEKLNGIGREYYSFGKLYSECEYLNGKKNGKGKEYDYNGNIIFEGQYFNGNKNGKCKEYDNNGNIIFEGEYKNGEKIENKDN